MGETSTTDGNDQQIADSTSTEQQTGQDANNLDSSASSDTSSDSTSQQVDTPAKFDSDLDEWIGKRGLSAPADDTQKQALQDLRNEQREFTRTQQAKKDVDVLKDGIESVKPPVATNTDEDFVDPLERRMNELDSRYNEERATRLRSEYYTSNNVTPEESQSILDIFKEKMERPTSDAGKREAFAYWSKPEALSELHELAKARIIVAAGTTGVAEKAAREERERIAKESQANSPGRNAKNTTTSDKTPEQERTERLKARYSSNTQ